jgi:hypothetical protein
MNAALIVGILFMGAGGAFLHDVPFVRFIIALMLILVGSTLIRIGME